MPNVNFLLRIFIGGLFIVSAIGKGLDDAAFAIELKTLLLPVASLFSASTGTTQRIMNAIEPFLPMLSLCVVFMELLIGAMLLVNIYLRSAAMLAALLLLVFTVVLALNLALPADTLKHCGCFGQLWNEPLDAWSLVRNATLFLMCVGIYFTSTQTTRQYATMADKT
jgi:uncharacterized membrane protein YphA (DoxX/SURF4 family)